MMGRFAILLVSLVSSVWCPQSCDAGIFGSIGNLGFDFIDGDTAIGNNMLTISNLRVDGNLLAPPAVMTDDFPNFRTLYSITYGQFLDFDFQVTNNFDPLGFSPDAFSFALLDNALTPTSFVTTDDPGGVALFSVSLDGSTPGGVLATALNTSPGAPGIDISWAPTPTYDSAKDLYSVHIFTGNPPVAAVPEPGSLAALGLLSLATFLRRKKR